MKKRGRGQTEQGLLCSDKEFGGRTAWAKAGVKGNHEAGAARGQEVRRACWDVSEGAEEVSRCLHLGVPGAELRRWPCKWTHRRRANH